MASPSQYRRNGRLAFTPDSRPSDHYKKYGKPSQISPAFKQFCVGWNEAKLAYTNFQATQTTILDFCEDCGEQVSDNEKEHCLGGVCYKCCEERHFVDEKICKNIGCPNDKCNIEKRKIKAK